MTNETTPFCILQYETHAMMIDWDDTYVCNTDDQQTQGEYWETHAMGMFDKCNTEVNTELTE